MKAVFKNLLNPTYRQTQNLGIIKKDETTGVNFIASEGNITIDSYKKAIELGNYELNTWLSRTDILIQIGELDAASLNLIQATEFYPENAEIEFRLTGIYYKALETEKGSYHLKNAMTFNKEFLFIIEELFPEVYHSITFQKALKKVQ